MNESRLLKKLDDVSRVEIIYEISNAMKFIHSQGLIHRDLKPSNILITDGKHVKICDFGLSRLSYGTHTSIYTTGIGTFGFMAPEIINNSGSYDNKVDVYSFGVVVFYILTKNEVKLKGGKIPSFPDYINSFSRELITKCISLEPKNRPTFDEIEKLILDNEFKMIDGIESEIPAIREHLGIE